MMKCPHCGAENENNAIYCRQCNGWILGKRYEEPTGGAQTENYKKCPNCGAKNALNAIFCHGCDSWILSDKFQEVTPPPAVEPPQPPQAEKPEKKAPRRMWLKIGVPVAAVAVITVILVMLFLPKDKPSGSGGTQAIQYAQNIMPYVHDGTLQVICDDTVLEMPFNASGYDSYQQSLDGKTAAILLQNGGLYLVRDQQLQYLDHAVTHYALSVSGDGILFATAGLLGYYHTSMDAPKWVPMTSSWMITDLAISPDGRSYAYIVRNPLNSTYHLMCSGMDSPGTSLGSVTSSTDLISISDGGEYIYVADSINVRCYNENGEEAFLGVYTNGNAMEARFTLNADHTQILFYYGGQTYLAQSGQKASVVCEAVASPILPQLCTEIYRNDICFSPYYDLLDAYYYELAYNAEPSFSSLLYHRFILWYVDSSGSSRKVADNVIKFLLDHSCSQLFYVDNKQTLYRYDIKDGQKDTVVEYAYTMVLSPDGEKLYYSYAEGLFCCDTEALSKVTKVSSDKPYTMFMGVDGRLYYLANGLCAVNNQGIPQQVFPGYPNYRISDNGYLYLTTADGYYVFGADRTAKLLFESSREPVERPYPNVTYG